VEIGDLVRSYADISRGVKGPLGIIVDMSSWTRSNRTYKSIHVFLFKSRTVHKFNSNELKVMK